MCASTPFRRNEFIGWVRPRHWGIAARSAAVSGAVTLVALTVAGVGLVAVLYGSLLAGVDDASAGRVHDIATALQTDSPADLDSALLTTDQRVVAVQLIGAEGIVVQRSASAPDKPLIPINEFGTRLRRGLDDDAVPLHDMRISGQMVITPSGRYTVLVGGGSEAVESTARTVAVLFAAAAPVVITVAAAASYWLVRRSLRSVDAIRSRVAEISTSDLAERVPVPTNRDEISALALTMNEMLSRIEAGHRAQQQFVGDASHELRSPLATIISGLEVAEAHPELLDARLTTDTLLPEAHRMRALIDDLLLLARADERDLALRKEELALDDIAAAEAMRLRRYTDRSVHTAMSPTHLIGDRAAMSRVIRNILDNAVRHAKSRIEIAVHSGDGNAILVIGDDGPGIPPAERVRVFDRFVRLDSDRSRSGGGSGLGLAIVADIVAAHGGTTVINDRAGGGTTITVTVPQHTNR
jgi:signal transduction histidine kinase